ncbi:MAG: TIGR02466 family protein [Bdellovibrionota bacterium]
MAVKSPILSYFPTLIYEAPLIKNSKSLNSLVKESKLDSLRIFEHDNEGHKWSQSHYANGYTSYSSISKLHEMNSTFMDLRKHIDKHVVKYVKALGLETEDSLEMVSCWLNIMPPGGTHSLHLHPLAVISGTFYVEVPKGSGVIKFEDPRLSKMMAAPPRKDKFESGAFARITPQKGHLVLFESWLRHEVEVNRGKNERISISFNYA